MEDNAIRIESIVELDQAISYLGNVLSGLRSRKLCIDQSGEALELTPQDMVSLQFKAKQQDDKESVSMKISWRLRPAAGDLPALKISSKSENEQS